MPYIALQLVGIQAVLEVVGVGGGDNWVAKDLPLFIAFLVLALYTYTSGLRAPAIIAFVKDILIYIVILVAVIYLPSKVGGWGNVFDAAEKKMTTTTNPATGNPNVFIPGPKAYWAYATLALGSAMALFMYPHSITATLSAKSRNTIRKNASILPAYSFLLGLLALLGWVAIAAGTKPIGLDGKVNGAARHPAALRGHVPVVVRRSRVRGHRHRRARAGGDHVDRGGQHLHAQHLQGVDQAGRHAQAGGAGQQDHLARRQGASRSIFVLTLDKSNAINFQLLGGIWILQTFPALVFYLYTRWFHRWALLAGWAVGMVYGTLAAYNVTNQATGAPFAGSVGEHPRDRRSSATSR